MSRSSDQVPSRSDQSSSLPGWSRTMANTVVISFLKRWPLPPSVLFGEVPDMGMTVQSKKLNEIPEAEWESAYLMFPQQLEFGASIKNFHKCKTSMTGSLMWPCHSALSHFFFFNLAHHSNRESAVLYLQLTTLYCVPLIPLHPFYSTFLSHLCPRPQHVQQLDAFPVRSRYLGMVGISKLI